LRSCKDLVTRDIGQETAELKDLNSRRLLEFDSVICILIGRRQRQGLPTDDDFARSFGDDFAIFGILPLPFIERKDEARFVVRIIDQIVISEASAIGFANALSADARIANDVGFTFNADEFERQTIAVRACGDIPCLFNVLIDQCFRSDFKPNPCRRNREH